MGRDRILLLSLILLIAATPLHAGTDQGSPPLIAEGYFGFGSAGQGQGSWGLSDWRIAAPNSKLLMQDVPMGEDFGGGYGGYSNYGSGPFGSYGGQSGMTYVGVGLQLGRGAPADAKLQKRLRVGVVYVANVTDWQTWGRSKTARYDTLVSQTTGQQVYRDTTYSERYDLSYSSSRIGLDLAYLVRRETASRWAWYLGLGMQLGSSFNDEVRISYQVYRPDLENAQLNSPYKVSEQREIHRPKSDLWGAGYALMGVDFVLSRKSSFLRNIHLFYELHPALLLSAPAGIPVQLQGSVQNIFGLRFDLR